MKKVLVAGATGYLGGYAVKAFKESGYWVRVLARSEARAQRLSPYYDDLFIGEITRPETLSTVCDGIDTVFSSIGITRQSDGLTYRDVDYQGNKNLLDLALPAGVSKFVYVSVFNAHEYEYLAVVKAHEDFVRTLKESEIDSTIIRPTGYFSDITEVFKMAQAGRVYFIGSGDNRMNPIHGADLAELCVSAAESHEDEIKAGGPEILTYREMALIAFEVLGKTPRISCIPPGLAKKLCAIVRVVRPASADKLSFLIAMSLADIVAPRFGRHTVREHFESLVHGLPAE